MREKFGPAGIALLALIPAAGRAEEAAKAVVDVETVGGITG